MAADNYFSTTKRGELQEWRDELNSNNSNNTKIRETLKKIIAGMTVGKDVSSLFSDVLKTIQTDDMERKKLVYLYLINYAKTNPDLAILAVNTFVNDATDRNHPLLRALALRTMSCIRVESITEYLSEPLRLGLEDTDPYVRKTAALAVAKLFSIDPELCRDHFMEPLKGLLRDSNQMVVSNAVAALTDITQQARETVWAVDKEMADTLLTALTECNEWGQSYILDGLATFAPQSVEDAEMVAERVCSRLQHANSAVVLSAIRVLVRLTRGGADFPTMAPEKAQEFLRRARAPIVSLLTSPPEIQYVVLRNVPLLLSVCPDMFAADARVFFCRYNDPSYVKVEKLEILSRLASDQNIDTILAEFKEYSQEVDVDFVRKTIQTIGRCAIALEQSANKCMAVLLELVATKVSYVVQEAIVVMKDVFRRYPSRFEEAIARLAEHLDSLDEPDAKASLVWIVGEYSDRIDNADDLLDWFMDTIAEEQPTVQFQLLTAVVKLYLNRPAESTQAMLHSVLEYVTEKADDPDLRDRGFLYWRMLSADNGFEMARRIVLAERPTLNAKPHELNETLREELLKHFGSLASVYQRPAASFTLVAQPQDDSDSDSEEESDEESEEESAPAQTQEVDNLADLLGGITTAAPPATTAPAARTFKDTKLAGVVAPANGKTLAVMAGFGPSNGKPALKVAVKNMGQAHISGFQVQFNKNPFGMVPESMAMGVPGDSLAPGAVSTVAVPFTFAAAPFTENPRLQVAVKTSEGVAMFAIDVPLHFIAEPVPMDAASILAAWQAAGNEDRAIVPCPKSGAEVCSLLNEAGIHAVAEGDSILTSASLPNGTEGRVPWVCRAMVKAGQMAVASRGGHTGLSSAVTSTMNAILG
ncbi:Adaptor Protein Complex 1/2, beta subunit (AP1/2B) [Carpediemonas membranifera]|uniref:Adaptor Protein Complex 1/2, beta subunit (AP1/2B) n=1 Tax=Carpediemonas membranifera TaxID=201153 RepID=A0A8J6B8P9_9EUKA|nr:Adaptor Protein Complex 1/2, beta subunit (AP1/2B) [Carpediemonas membranifera]|eukprot:KAG9396559.1 Adaptor Protein Complex 1/2, beta subunit (AP1/2B) [Carpediemonas membranifera]